VIVIIIIIVVVAIIVSYGTNESPSDSMCSNDKDCELGYVCINSSGKCKAGTGTKCSGNSDCATDLVCINNICSSKQPPIIQRETKSTKKKNVSWAKHRTYQPVNLSVPVVETIGSETIASTIVETISSETVPIIASEKKELTIIEKMAQTIATQNKEPIRSYTSLTDDSKSTSQNMERTPTIRPVVNKSRVINTVTPLTDFRVSTENSRNNIPGRRNIGITDATTIDDEINSEGTRSDLPFDLRSGESTCTREIVSTPCEEKDGSFYCRNNKIEIIDGKFEHSPVINVCSYSNATIFLLMNGNAICEIDGGSAKKRYRVTNSVVLRQMTSYDGYLYGVTIDNKLYTLPNSNFNNTNWIWNYVDWAPDNTKHISSTHDASHLWIQTDLDGYLYGTSGCMISKISYKGMRRVYGRDENHYIDIDGDKYKATINPGGDVYDNIVDAALSYYDEIVAIHRSEVNEYRGVTIINWKPYYIRA
jgi:hypothetical protein